MNVYNTLLAVFGGVMMVLVTISSHAANSDISQEFTNIQLPDKPTVVAPDGSDVRVLCRVKGGSMIQFHLNAGQVSGAVRHRTVEEIWYVLSGDGFLWRKQGNHTEVTKLTPGLSLTIPIGTEFQFKATTNSDLSILAVTMPPWPGEDEAVHVVGPW